MARKDKEGFVIDTVEEHDGYNRWSMVLRLMSIVIHLFRKTFEWYIKAACYCLPISIVP